MTVVAEPVSENHFRAVGTDGTISYGIGRLAGPASFRGEQIQAELLAAVNYVAGSGPFSGFWTFDFPNGDRLAFTYEGRTDRRDAGTLIRGTLRVLGGTGAMTGVRGTGTIRGERMVDVGGAVRYDIRLELTGLP